MYRAGKRAWIDRVGMDGEMPVMGSTGLFRLK
jgi:hypothetical protein